MQMLAFTIIWLATFNYNHYLYISALDELADIWQQYTDTVHFITHFIRENDHFISDHQSHNLYMFGFLVEQDTFQLLNSVGLLELKQNLYEYRTEIRFVSATLGFSKSDQNKDLAQILAEVAPKNLHSL